MDVDTPVGSLSKKSRMVKGAEASDDEEPGSSPVASSPLPPRSSPPPPPPEEEVKEVTTGVKEIDLDRKPDTPLSDPSEVLELPAILDAEPSAVPEEEPKTKEDVAPEGRPEIESAPEVEGSQDPDEGDSTDIKPVEEPTDDTKDTTNIHTECAQPFPTDLGSPSVDSQAKSSVASEDKPEAET
jgi:hypothetical protein